MSVSEHVRSVKTPVLRLYTRFAYFEGEGWMMPVTTHLPCRSYWKTHVSYASSSWWGFTSASDRQRLEAFLRRGRRYGISNADEQMQALSASISVSRY